MNETFGAFKKYNIVKAMVSGSPESVDTWAANDKDNRVIKGIALDKPGDFGLDSLKFVQIFIKLLFCLS